MDAGDRWAWSGKQDERPLTSIGRRQAMLMAEVLMQSRLDALYSSPALRCRQTLEPLSEKLGLEVVVTDELREASGYALPPEWERTRAAPTEALGAAYAAGRMFKTLREIQAEVGRGRVAVCSHGDVIPALLALLRGSEDDRFPPPHERRGGWHTLAMDGAAIRVVQHPLIEGFPDA